MLRSGNNVAIVASEGGSLPDGASGPQPLLGAPSVCGSLGVGPCELLAGEVFAENRKIAEHKRVFSKCKWKIDPLHYLDLIGQRPGSFESARPILQWRARWPADYEVLLARLRSRLGENSGTREFVGILGLHQHYPKAAVEKAIARVLELQCPSLASIRHWIRYRYEKASLLVTSNLAFAEWTRVFGDASLTAALLDRLTHRCQIYEFDWESIRLAESLKRQKKRRQQRAKSRPK